jgi:low affinity Fe/Cu permease
MPDDRHRPELPSQVSGRIGLFDRFAERASRLVSQAPFFAACVLLVLIWAPTILFLNFDAWQLLINTATTIVTFLLVALLQNSQTRNDQATQHKLNAIADGLVDLMEHVGGENQALRREVHELKLAVGLERHEGTTENLASAEPST